MLRSGMLLFYIFSNYIASKMMSHRVVPFIVFVCLFCRCPGYASGHEDLYPNNPFLTGFVKPDVGTTLTVTSPSLQIIHHRQEITQNDLKKYCLQPEGHFPSTYCNKFVMCWNEQAAELFCPEDLVFNPQGFCDYPYNVDCGGKPVQPIKPVIHEDNSVIPQPLPPSSLPIVNDIPSSGSSQPISSPQETTFILRPPSSLSNQWPIDGSYKPPPVPQTLPPFHIPIINDTNKQSSPSGFLPQTTSTITGWPTDGSYKPPQQTLILGWPTDGSYKPPLQIIDAVKPSVPANLPAVVLPSQLPGKIPLQKFCLQPRGQFPGASCGKYVNCWDNVVVEQECPEGLHFNSLKKYCDYPSSYSCDHTKPASITPSQNPHLPTSTTAPVPAHSTTSQPILANPALHKLCLKPRGQFPGSTCNKFVNCWDNNVVEQDCPEGLVFNAPKGYCDYPGNYHCSVQQHKSLELGKSNDCLLPEGTFRNRDNCFSFYTCIDNRVVAQYECPEGYIFNDVLGVCDLKDRVNCTEEPFIHYPSVRKSNDVYPLPAAVIDPSLPCKEGTMFRLNADCSHVAICRNGLTEIIYCPSGLKYDFETDKCLEPQIAKC